MENSQQWVAKQLEKKKQKIMNNQILAEKKLYIIICCHKNVWPSFLLLLSEIIAYVLLLYDTTEKNLLSN